MLYLLHGSEHMAKLGLILGLHHNDIGYAAHHADIEKAVVGGAIIRRKPGAIHTEPDRKALQGSIVLNHIHTALHECGINGQIGLIPLSGLTTGKDGGVLLCYTHIVKPLGELAAEDIELGPTGHSRGNSRDGRVILSQAGKALAEGLGISNGCRLGGTAVRDIILTDTMELGGVSGRRFIALAFLRNDVKNDVLLPAGCYLQYTLQTGNIVTVYRAVIGEAQLLEETQRTDKSPGRRK